MNRNIIEEIKNIQIRKGDLHELDVTMRINYLSDKLNKNYSSNEDFVKYFPVTIIACFEAYFSLIVEELINEGEPFSNNIEKLDFKIDTNLLNALLGKEFTIGKLYAHSLSFSNLSQIDKVFINIFNDSGGGLRKRVKKYVKEIYEIQLETTDENILEIAESFISVSPKLITDLTDIIQFTKNYDQIIKDVNELYEIRHIICHELDCNKENVEIINLCKNALLFLRVCKYYFDEEVFKRPSIEKTIESVKKELNKKETQLNDLLIEFSNNNLGKVDKLTEITFKFVEEFENYSNKAISSVISIEDSKNPIILNNFYQKYLTLEKIVEIFQNFIPNKIAKRKNE